MYIFFWFSKISRAIKAFHNKYPIAPGAAGAPVTVKPKKIKRKDPMKPLNWIKLNPNNVKGTILEKIDNTKLKFNLDEFCEIVAKAETKPNAPPKKTDKEKTKKRCFSRAW